MVSTGVTDQVSFNLPGSALIFQGIRKLPMDLLVILNFIIAAFLLLPLVLPYKLSVEINNA